MAKNPDFDYSKKCPLLHPWRYFKSRQIFFFLFHFRCQWQFRHFVNLSLKNEIGGKRAENNIGNFPQTHRTEIEEREDKTIRHYVVGKEFRNIREEQTFPSGKQGCACGDEKIRRRGGGGGELTLKLLFFLLPSCITKKTSHVRTLGFPVKIPPEIRQGELHTQNLKHLISNRGREGGGDFLVNSRISVCEIEEEP